MIKITSEPLNPEEITAQVRRDSNGAVITFLGTTRDFSEGRNVEYLEYEAYQPMAENMLQQIADELREKWGIDDFAVAHRVAGSTSERSALWWRCHLPTDSRLLRPAST